jgi:leucine efflux protein
MPRTQTGGTQDDLWLPHETARFEFRLAGHSETNQAEAGESLVFGIQHYLSFISAILLFQLAPGPGTLAILSATARDGVRSGLGAVLGTLLGDFLYMLAAVLGLAAVLAAYPIAFSAMRWCGIAYLIWIGLTFLRTASNSESTTASVPMSWRAHLRRAFAVSLTNPKVIMFFMAFFPLFLRSDASPATLGIMMIHVTALSFLYQFGLVLVGNLVSKRLSRFHSARTIVTRLAGVAIIGFGIRLALDRR